MEPFGPHVPNSTNNQGLQPSAAAVDDALRDLAGVGREPGAPASQAPGLPGEPAGMPAAAPMRGPESSGPHRPPGSPGLPPTAADGASSRLAILSSTVLAPLVGRMATPAAGQERIGLHGTDLGLSFEHRGSLYFLFGDTWADQDATAIDPRSDDVQGAISMDEFPDGYSVDAYIRAHPPEPGEPDWHASAPPVRFPVDARGRVAPIRVVSSGEPVTMGLGRTPVAAWSDGSDVFAVFHRWIPVECSGGLAPSCGDGYVCDRGLGTALSQQGDLAFPCVLAEYGCTSVPGGGLCQDRTSSVYSNTRWGRVQSVVVRDEIGNMDRTQPGRYLTRTFDTLKFRNPAVRTVRDFDPTRRHGSGNVYAPADGSGPREKVFIWGRPAFGAPAARGSNARLYFMYMDMPAYSETGEVERSAHYFTGLRDGVPQFSRREIDARPVDLSAPGGDPTVEQWDIVAQMSVSYVEALGKWVMLYGGDLPEVAIPFIVGPESMIEPDPEGAIHLRFADHPWGPWSPPEQVIGAVDGPDGAASVPAAPGGIVRRPGCLAAHCPPHEAAYADDEIGVMYAASIVEPWTQPLADGSVDLYWTVSTWDPYQVVLLKSRLALVDDVRP